VLCFVHKNSDVTGNRAGTSDRRVKSMARVSQETTGISRRNILHVDMDCFFVAVERLKDPSLVGKPVIVGGDPDGRGVVSSAAYEAREFGVHSAMPASRARQLCPEAIFIRGHFEDYDDYSLQVRAILEQYTPLVEMASIDEAYLDLTGTERLFGTPLQTAETIKKHILRETGLVASFGAGTNKLIAKIASDFGKPDAITVVWPGYETEFLDPMEIRKLPGVGPRTEEKLQAMGVQTIGDLARLEPERLERMLGDRSRAESLHRRALGHSETPVVSERVRKSISKEITFREDIGDAEYLLSVLHYLAGQVVSKLRLGGKRALTVTIKYRYPDFETHTRAQTLDEPTGLTDVVYEVAHRLLMESADVGRGVRLIGVGVTQLQECDEQLDLFDSGVSGEGEAEHRLQAIEELRRKFGYDAVVSGQSVNLLRKKNLRGKDS